MLADNARLSIVLPCYNEAEGLPNLLDRYAEFAARYQFELVLVDNGSTDNTQEVIGRLLPKYAFARCTRVIKNVGYGHGIFQGLKQAQGEFLAWSHADLQTDGGDVFRAYDSLKNAQNVSRTLVKGRRRGRRLSERFISRGMELASLCLLRSRLTEINAQPKVFHRDLLSFLTKPPTDFNFDVYVLYKANRAGWAIREVEVDFPPRPFGESHWAATWRSKFRTIRRSLFYMGRLSMEEG